MPLRIEHKSETKAEVVGSAPATSGDSNGGNAGAGSFSSITGSSIGRAGGGGGGAKGTGRTGGTASSGGGAGGNNLSFGSPGTDNTGGGGGGGGGGSSVGGCNKYDAVDSKIEDLIRRSRLEATIEGRKEKERNGGGDLCIVGMRSMKSMSSAR